MREIRKTITDTTFAIVPRALPRDIVPLALLGVVGALCATVCVFAVYGAMWSVAKGELLGASVSVVFTVLFGWLTRLAVKTLGALGPRRLEYSRATETFVMTRWGIPIRIPRTQVRAVQPRIEVNRGGFKSAPGIWLYLVLRTASGEERLFYLQTLPALDHLHRAEIRALFKHLGEFSNVPVQQPEIQNCSSRTKT